MVTVEGELHRSSVCFKFCGPKQNKLKQNTFISFIDMRKAFDNVNRQCLWYKLQTVGIGGSIFKAIQSLYNDVSYAVKVNGSLTSWFRVSKGVKQGCNLS